MLALFRVECALNSITVYQISKSVPYFQWQKGYSCGGCKMVGGNNVWMPKWRAASVQASSSEETGVDANAEVKSQVQVPASSSSGGLKRQDGHGGAEFGTELAEPNDSKSASSKDKHSMSMLVGSSLFRFIKGKWGSMQARIEEETGARLIFPSSRNGESLIIEGTSPDSVGRASERIQLLIDEIVKSSALDYSHFISLPLAIHPQLVDKLVNFQNSILGRNDASPNEVFGSSSNRDDTKEEDGDRNLVETPQVVVTLKSQENSENIEADATKIPLVSYAPKPRATFASKPKTPTLFELGIDKSIFINPKTLHLTVLMLKLWNTERVNAAVKIFKGIEAEVMDALHGRPVSIKLKGLDCMKGSFEKARVLYAPVEVVGGEDRLLHACKIITDAFIKGGLVLERDANHTLKLHATVMNVRQRKRGNDTRRYDPSNWFDARGIMERYGTEDWGEYDIPEVHLSQRCEKFPLFTRCCIVILVAHGLALREALATRGLQLIPCSYCLHV